MLRPSYIFKVLDSITIFTDDSNNIKSIVILQAQLLEVGLSNFPHRSDFFEFDRLVWVTKIRAISGFYFDKNQFVKFPIQSNDINFIEAKPNILCQNLVIFCKQIIGGELFTQTAELLITLLQLLC